jgi:glycosyltransferase involved in cell wall biosynthesis
MGSPLVSVCMPVYNGARFLEEAVRSVLAQSYPNFELQVFDDASTDGSWDLLQGIRDPRLVLHRNARNLGPEANWNKAMASATGKYIKLFHQDDLLAPECLEQQVRALEREASSVLAFCRRTIIRADGRRLMTRGGPWKSGIVSASEVFRRCVLAGSNLVGEPSAILFRAETARRVGEFDGSIPYLIDLDYWLRLLAFGPAWHERNALASFRISSRQWSVAIGRRQSQAFIDFSVKVLAEGRFQMGPLARGWGRAMASLNGLLRVWIYRLVLKDA